MITVKSLRLKNKKDYVPSAGDRLYLVCSDVQYMGNYRVIGITVTVFTIQHEESGFKLRIRASTLSPYSLDVNNLIGFLGIYKTIQDYETNMENQKLLRVLVEAVTNDFVEISLDNSQLNLVLKAMDLI
jgi:hypothetical protein